MANAVAIPGQPGRILTKTGDVIQQETTYEGDFWDTVEFVTFAAGTNKYVFKDQSNKELHHTNLSQPKRIPSKATIKLMRIGVLVRNWCGAAARPSPEDVVVMYDRCTLKFVLGSTNLIAEGLLLQFPSGLGLTGVSTANDFTVLANGVASSAAAPRLEEQQDIDDSVDLNCALRTDAQTWLSADSGQPTMIGNGVLAHIEATVFLHGIITKPLGG